MTDYTAEGGVPLNKIFFIRFRIESYTEAIPGRSWVILAIFEILNRCLARIWLIILVRVNWAPWSCLNRFCCPWRASTRNALRGYQQNLSATTWLFCRLKRKCLENSGNSIYCTWLSVSQKWLLRACSWKKQAILAGATPNWERVKYLAYTWLNKPTSVKRSREIGDLSCIITFVICVQNYL